MSMVITEAHSPFDMTWPVTLPVELALRTATPEEIRIEYGFSKEAWEALPRNPTFIKALTDACELVRQEGMSFKLKAQLIAEENLKQLWKMVHASSNDEVAPAVKASLITACARWAGYEQRPSSAGEGGGGNTNTTALQINITMEDKL